MFRFTIRDVLWLTALVAMGAGWWVDHRHAAQARWLQWELDNLTQLIESRGYEVANDPNGVGIRGEGMSFHWAWRDRQSPYSGPREFPSRKALPDDN